MAEPARGRRRRTRRSASLGTGASSMASSGQWKWGMCTALLALLLLAGMRGGCAPVSSAIAAHTRGRRHGRSSNFQFLAARTIYMTTQFTSPVGARGAPELKQHPDKNNNTKATWVPVQTVYRGGRIEMEAQCPMSPHGRVLSRGGGGRRLHARERRPLHRLRGRLQRGGRRRGHLQA